jgi:hypothetical protein
VRIVIVKENINDTKRLEKSDERPVRCPECRSDDPAYMPGGWTRAGISEFEDWVPCPNPWHDKPWHSKDAYENAQTIRYIAEGRYRPGMIVRLDWRDEEYKGDEEWGEIVDPWKEGWHREDSAFVRAGNAQWTRVDDARFVPVFSYESEGRTGGHGWRGVKVIGHSWIDIPFEAKARRIFIGDCPVCEYYNCPEDYYICDFCRFGIKDWSQVPGMPANRFGDFEEFKPSV